MGNPDAPAVVRNLLGKDRVPGLISLSEVEVPAGGRIAYPENNEAFSVYMVLSGKGTGKMIGETAPVSYMGSVQVPPKVALEIEASGDENAETLRLLQVHVDSFPCYPVKEEL